MPPFPIRSASADATPVRPLREGRRRLAWAISLAFVAGGATTGVSGLGDAHAQAAPETRLYSIEAGPLTQVLARFVGESGIWLVADAGLAAGLNSPGLQGSHTAAAGLAQILAGSGLEAVRGAQGEYQLRRAEGRTSGPAPASAPRAGAATAAGSAAASAVLAPVQVTAESERIAITEGTRSYTSRVTNTATRLPLSPRETPQSISVLTRQRLDDQGLKQLSDAVVETPGLVMSTSGNVGTDSSPIYSRGFQLDTYMLDGVRQIDSNYTDIYQTMDLAVVDRIEVLRGASGLLNGIGSPAGAINVIRKRPLPGFAASARVEAGSWQQRRIQGDVSTVLNEVGTVRARVVGAIQRNDSYIDRLNEKREIFYAVGEMDLTASTLAHIGYSYQHFLGTAHARGGRPSFNADGSIAQWSRSDSAAANWAYSSRRQNGFFGGVEHRFSPDLSVKATLARTTTKYDDLLGYAARGYADPTTGAGMGLWAGRWTAPSKQDSFDVSVTGRFDLLGRKHDFVVGTQLARTTYSTPNYTNWTHAGWSPDIANIYNWDGSTPAEPSNPPIGWGTSDERMNSAYATVRLKPLEGMGVILGARVTDWKRRTTTLTYATGAMTGTDRSETGEVTPYAGITYDMTRHWTAYASYTNIFKPQSSRLVDDSFIDPQTGDSYEVGVKGAFHEDRLNVGAAIYEVRQDNLAVALVNVFTPSGLQAYRAESGTKTRGFEFEVAGQVLPGWQVSASFARNQTEDRNGLPLLTDVPRSSFKLYTSYRMDQLGHGLTVGGGLRWQNATHTDNMGPNSARIEQSAYAVVDLMARYAITPKIGLSANIYNLFDKHYHLKPANSYYGAPRHARVALDIRY